MSWEKLAVFTTDRKLGAKLIEFLRKHGEQETTDEVKTLLVVGYNERDAAIQYLAKDVPINTDNPDKPFVEDYEASEFFADLNEELTEEALEQAKKEKA